MIVNILGISLFIILLSFIFGLLFQLVFKKSDLLAILPEGFLCFLAIFQVLATPLLILHAPYSIALGMFISLVVLGTLCAAVLIWKKKIQLPRPVPPNDRFFRITLILALLLVLGQAAISTIFTFGDADDIYYVGLANTNIHAPALYAYDPSTGMHDYPVISQYRFESFELLLGIFADISGLPAAGIFHSIMPFILISLAYLAYVFLARQLIADRYVPLFIVILSIFHIFGGYSAFSQGSYLLTRVWQGKSVLLHLILPMIMGLGLQFFESGYPFRMVLQMAILLLAGIAVTPVAVFLPTAIIVLYCFFYWIKTPRRLFAIGLMALSFIPIGLYALAIRMGVQSSKVYI
jgi:hypothetical protein